MKDLTFSDQIGFNQHLSDSLYRTLTEEFKQFFNLEVVEVYTDDTDNNKNYQKNYSSVKYFLIFILNFFYNILYNSDVAVKRKKSPYNLRVVLTSDFSEGKLQYYFFLDDAIIGLVIGKQFLAIRNLIQAVYPIMSKIGMDCEIRVFPISRFDSIYK